MCSAFGCSTFNPSINQRYCCGVNCRSSRSFRGHWYTPRSRRLYRRMKPSCSQYRPLIRSRRRPQKRKSVLVKGSSSNSCCTIAERPSIPFLRSVYPQAMNTRSAPLKSFSIAQSLAQRGYHIGIGSAVYFQRRLADANAGDQIVLHWQRRQLRKYMLRFLWRF